LIKRRERVLVVFSERKSERGLREGVSVFHFFFFLFVVFFLVVFFLLLQGINYTSAISDFE